MLAVSIYLPFGRFFQAGLKLMALIYRYPGLKTYLLHWVPNNLTLTTNLEKKDQGQ